MEKNSGIIKLSKKKKLILLIKLIFFNTFYSWSWLKPHIQVKYHLLCVFRLFCGWNWTWMPHWIFWQRRHCVRSSHNYTLRFTIRVTIATKHNTAVAHSLRAVFEVAFWRNLCVIFWERPFDVLNHVSHLWCEALQDKLKSFITATTTFTFVQQDWEYVGSRVSFLLTWLGCSFFRGSQACLMLKYEKWCK